MQADQQSTPRTEGCAPQRQDRTAAAEHGELLLMLGHEMRNPLNAIATAVEVLNRAPAGSPEAESARRIIGRQTRGLARLLDELGDIGRAMTDETPLLRQPLELGALTQRCVAHAAAAMAAKTQTVDVELAPVWVDADAQHIAKAIDRALDHVVRCTPPGGRIEVRMTTRPGAAGAEAVIDMRGSGNGTSPEPPLRRAGRAGIGLSLARSLVEKHGGRLDESGHDAASGCLRGLTLRLPAGAAPGADPELPAQVQARVGVIDDNADALFGVCALLELGGHAVTTAVDGPGGVAMLMRDAPDVAIVDIGLPGFDGCEVARRSRAAGFRGRLIALSGYGSGDDAHRSLAAGFEAHLVKPVDADQLLRLLDA